MPLLPERRSHDKTSAIIELRNALRRAVDAEVGRDAPFAVREESALMLTNGAVRENLEEDLQALADEYGEDVLVDGELYRQHQPGTVPYHSLCGALHVDRWTYRRVGERNGATVVPRDLAAGLMERGTPARPRSRRPLRRTSRPGRRSWEAAPIPRGTCSSLSRRTA